MAFKIYLIFLFFAVGYLNAVKFRCDYRFRGSGWYKYHEIPATWDDARWMCHFEGGILASPTTDQITTSMLRHFDSEIFTGIQAYPRGQFRSIDGIKLDEISYKWANDEPDNKFDEERCIAMDNLGKLSDVKCDEPRPYICFRPNSTVNTNECGTPDSGYSLDRRVKKCYKFHTKPKTYVEADFACAAEGGHLAMPNNDLEANIIRQLYAKYPNEKMLGNFYKERILLGFYKVGDKFGADWITIHGQPIEKSGYSKFGPGEPNSQGGENCGSMFRSGLLNDTPCDMTGPFVCEKKPNYPPVCENR